MRDIASAVVPVWDSDVPVGKSFVLGLQLQLVNLVDQLVIFSVIEGLVEEVVEVINLDGIIKLGSVKIYAMDDLNMIRGVDEFPGGEVWEVDVDVVLGMVDLIELLDVLEVLLVLSLSGSPLQLGNPVVQLVVVVLDGDGSGGSLDEGEMLGGVFNGDLSGSRFGSDWDGNLDSFVDWNILDDSLERGMDNLPGWVG